MSRLLILACSKRKRSESAPLPAIERYDGPAFRVLRKYRRECSTQAPHTLILSGRYGVIDESIKIPVYDERLTSEGAACLQSEIRWTVAQTERAHGPFDSGLLCAGGAYLDAIGNLESLFTDARVELADGSIGRQISLLHEWLYRGHERPDTGGSELSNSPVELRGKIISGSAKEVITFARKRAGADPDGASRFQTWYVQAGEKQVAPKWLVSELTGIPVSDFRTADARRVLGRLGVDVQRV